MAKQKDQSGKYIAWFIIFSAASAMWTWMKNTYTQLSIWVNTHWTLIAIAAAAIVVSYILLVVIVKWFSAKEHQDKVEALRAKYEDESIVEKILDNKFWLGATEEMLLDSLGDPDDKDIEVMKTKTKETWKYGKIQANQYRLRIYLVNGLVTKWENKGA